MKETDLPKDVPTETEEPDRIVTANDTKKPEKEEQEVAAVQTTASTELVAAEATATPSSEAIPEGRARSRPRWEAARACGG